MIGVEASIDGLNSTISVECEPRCLYESYGLAPKVRGEVHAGCRNRLIRAISKRIGVSSLLSDDLGTLDDRFAQA